MQDNLHEGEVFGAAFELFANLIARAPYQLHTEILERGGYKHLANILRGAARLNTALTYDVVNRLFDLASFGAKSELELL